MWLGFCQAVGATCVTVDQTGWTQHQKNMLPAVAYTLIFESGLDEVPTVSDRGEVCVTSDYPELRTILKTSKVVTQHNLDEATRDAAAVTQAAERVRKLDDVKSRLLSIGFTSDEAATILEAIERGIR